VPFLPLLSGERVPCSEGKYAGVIIDLRARLQPVADVEQEKPHLTTRCPFLLRWCASFFSRLTNPHPLFFLYLENLCRPFCSHLAGVRMKKEHYYA
jgi:hypothetical protein